MPSKIVISSLFSEDYELKLEQKQTICSDCFSPSVGTSTGSNEEACLLHYYTLHATQPFAFKEYD